MHVLDSPSLARLTSIGIGGQAVALLEVRDVAECAELPDVLAKYAAQGAVPLALGKGTNLIGREGSLSLVLVRTRIMDAPQVLEEHEDEHDDERTVRVGAGVALQRLVGWAAREGLAGLEGLAGIPGAVGGSVAMNAGSYGTWLGDRLSRVQVWTAAEGVRWMDRAECTFGYRQFAPAGVGTNEFYLIVGAELRLKRATSAGVRTRTDEHFATKRAGQPITARTAGCVFKNPPGQSAGKLIDAVGLRGVGRGRMVFSPRHANFLANLGGGSWYQAHALLVEARNRVFARYGVELELEARVVG